MSEASTEEMSIARQSKINRDANARRANNALTADQMPNHGNVESNTRLIEAMMFNNKKEQAQVAQAKAEAKKASRSNPGRGLPDERRSELTQAQIKELIFS